MRSLKLIIMAISIGLLLFFGQTASADPIGGPNNTNCTNDSCQGATYTLFFSGVPISMTVNSKTYRVTYTIDTSTYTGDGVKLDTVALKIANSITSATLFSAPGGTAIWNIQMGGLNANGCSGAGSGFACAMAALDDSPTVGGTLIWVFDLEVPNSATLFDGPFEASIKARYINDDGEKEGALVSENITLQHSIPEPATLLLVGSGLVALARSRTSLRL